MNFDEIFGRAGCVPSNSWLDFGGNSDHNHRYRNFKGIFSLRVVDNAEAIMMGSVALVEVYCLQMLLFQFYYYYYYYYCSSACRLQSAILFYQFCPSVGPSNAGTGSKSMDVSSPFFANLVGASF